MEKRRKFARKREKMFREGCFCSFVMLVISFEFFIIMSLTSTSGNIAVEARYLPTRSDDTQVQVLKDLIRGIVAQSKVNAAHQKQQSTFDSRLYPLELVVQPMVQKYPSNSLMEIAENSLQFKPMEESEAPATRATGLTSTANVQRRTPELLINGDSNNNDNNNNEDNYGGQYITTTGSGGGGGALKQSRPMLKQLDERQK